MGINDNGYIRGLVGPLVKGRNKELYSKQTASCKTKYRNEECGERLWAGKPCRCVN